MLLTDLPLDALTLIATSIADSGIIFWRDLTNFAATFKAARNIALALPHYRTQLPRKFCGEKTGFSNPSQVSIRGVSPPPILEWCFDFKRKENSLKLDITVELVLKMIHHQSHLQHTLTTTFKPQLKIFIDMARRFKTPGTPLGADSYDLQLVISDQKWVHPSGHEVERRLASANIGKVLKVHARTFNDAVNLMLDIDSADFYSLKTTPSPRHTLAIAFADYCLGASQVFGRRDHTFHAALFIKHLLDFESHKFYLPGVPIPQRRLGS